MDIIQITACYVVLAVAMTFIIDQYVRPPLKDSCEDRMMALMLGIFWPLTLVLMLVWFVYTKIAERM